MAPALAAQKRLAARESRLLKARQLAAQDVQLEVVISLANVPAYFPESAADAEIMYEQLRRLAVEALSNTSGPIAAYSIIADTILAKRTSDEVATAPPDPPTLPPLTPGPPANGTVPVSAAVTAQPVAVVAWTLVMAFVASVLVAA